MPLGVEDPAPLAPTSPLANASPKQSDYIISANTVIDTNTRLEWQREIPTIQGSDTLTLEDAFFICRDLGNQWRLPSARELQSIVDYGKDTPAINEVAFPFTPSANFWTSSRQIDVAWELDFATGVLRPIEFSSAGLLKYVRCVKDHAS